MQPSHGLCMAVRSLVKVGVDRAGNETAAGPVHDRPLIGQIWRGQRRKRIRRLADA